MDLQRLLAILSAALFTCGVFCVPRDASPDPERSMHVAASAPAALVAARLDVANLAGVDPREVALANVEPAFWDGCLGVRAPGEVCTLEGIGGTIARFEADGHEYRYHIAGNRYLGPVDPALATDDGPPPAEIAPDTEAALAAYARSDLALRQGIDPTDVTVEAALPGACGPGEPLPNVSCVRAGAYRAALQVTTNGGQYFFEIVSDGTTQRLTPAERPSLQDPAIEAVQDEMRTDLAKRLHLGLDQVSILSYSRVQWPDACLGIEQSGQVCAQVVTPGFSATLLASLGYGETEKLYTYRGARDHFIAADFIPTADILPPPASP